MSELSPNTSHERTNALRAFAAELMIRIRQETNADAAGDWQQAELARSVALPILALGR
jgi:hypothetical protein